MTRLEKIDAIRDRTNLGYKEAVELLDASNEDLIDALVRYESRPKGGTGWWNSVGEGFARKIRQLIKTGNVTRVRVKQGQRTVLEIPVTAGVVGTFIAPELVAMGAAACLFTRCTIELERANGDVDLRYFGKDVDPLRP